MWELLAALYGAGAILYLIQNLRIGVMGLNACTARNVYVPTWQYVISYIVIFTVSIIWPVSVYKGGWRMVLLSRTQRELDDAVQEQIDN